MDSVKELVSREVTILAACRRISETISGPVDTLGAVSVSVFIDATEVGTMLALALCKQDPVSGRYISIACKVIRKPGAYVLTVARPLSHIKADTYCVIPDTSYIGVIPETASPCTYEVRAQIQYVHQGDKEEGTP